MNIIENECYRKDRKSYRRQVALTTSSPRNSSTALDCLFATAHSDDITFVKVPGAFEIPWRVACAWSNPQYDDILGAVIRGRATTTTIT